MQRLRQCRSWWGGPALSNVRVDIFCKKKMFSNYSQKEFGKCLLSFNFILDPLIHPLFLFAVLPFIVNSVTLEITHIWPRKTRISQSLSKCAEGRFSGAYAFTQLFSWEWSPPSVCPSQRKPRRGLKDRHEAGYAETTAGTCAFWKRYCFEACAQFV